jgi:uncharacterized membrane protein
MVRFFNDGSQAKPESIDHCSRGLHPGAYPMLLFEYLSPMTRHAKTTPPLLVRMKGLHKLFVCILAGVLCFGLLGLTGLVVQHKIILSWDLFCIMMISFSWIVFVQTNEKELANVCEQQDDGLKAIFIIVLATIFASLFGTVLLLTGKTENASGKIIQMLISLSPVLFSWFLLHTIFTIRYAHLYNDQHRELTGTVKDGLEFPGKKDPDYLDFAYFSFVIGMTFQVSDVSVSSRSMRRFVLLHSLISFAFNTIIVALTINAVAGLKD